jgi:hypothetical protein
MRGNYHFKIIVSVVNKADMFDRSAGLFKAAGIDFKPIVGELNGIKETGFILNSLTLQDFQNNLNLAKKIAAMNQQNKVLIIDNENTAMLTDVYQDTNEKLGALEVVSKDEALATKNYTCIPDSGVYFVCR